MTAKVDINSVPDITFLKPGDEVLEKIQICLCSKAGVKQADITTKYNINRRTIQRLKNSLEKEGVRGLIDKPRSGRPVLLNDEQKAMAIRMKALDGSLSCKAIADKISKDTGISVSHKTIEVLLKSCSLITYHGKGVKKTRSMPKERNPKKPDI